jgi:hypothetical protein
MKELLRALASAMAILGALPSLAGPELPCRVGVQMHLHPPLQYSLNHMKMFVEKGMAKFAFIVAQGFSDDEMDQIVGYLADKKVPFLLQEPFPMSNDWFAVENKTRRFDRADYDRIRAKAGDLFLGVHWGEIDSSGLKPENYLSPEVLKNPTRVQVADAFVATVREKLERFKAEYTAPYAHSSGTLSHHLFGEAGMDILCSEVGENIPNIDMMVASNRGAARAYGKPWMIDHSTWWSPRGNVGEQVSPREGHTPWLLFTSLLIGAMGGADYVQLEVDWAAYDKDYNLLPWGTAMQTMYSLAAAIGPRGETVTPFAILMGRGNGWPGVGWRVNDVRATGLFDGIRHAFMQTRDADLSWKIADVFYPGFERCGWDPEYTGFVSESPIGTLDIVPDNLDLSKYTRYPVLVSLGYHRTSDETIARWRQYVEQGGILICGDSLFLDEAEHVVDPKTLEPLIGCTVDTSEANLVQLDQPKGKLQAIAGLTDEADCGEWQTHWLHPVALSTGTVAATLNDTPFLVHNVIGKGHVFFVTALNMTGNSATKRGAEPFLFANILARFLHALKAHAGDGVTISPWTSLDHILTERKDGTGLLLVMNHGDMNCRRDIALRNARGYARVRTLAQGTWQSWTPGEQLTVDASGGELKWSYNAPAKSFVLFALEGAEEKRP